MKNWQVVSMVALLSAGMSAASAQNGQGVCGMGAGACMGAGGGACVGQGPGMGQGLGAGRGMGRGGWNNAGQGRGMQGQMLPQRLAALPVQTPNAAEKRSMAYMREEEKLAHDVYAQLHQQWGSQTPVFGRIVTAEARHTESMRQLLQRHGLEDPAAQAAPGQFKHAELQKLYNDLTAKGKTSLVEALRVGALIEEVDILDLQKDLAQTQNEAIRLVYGNLLRGSQNHLRAFVRALGWQGVQYQPQQMSASEFQAALNS